MANETELNEQIEAARQSDDAAAVRQYRAQLGEHLAKGADTCSNCGNDVIGMVKTPVYTNRDGVEMPAVYEVGCIVCPPFWVDSEAGDDVTLDGKKAKIKRRSYSARAVSVKEAVRKWNAGEWIEDNQLDRNIPAVQLARLEK